MIGRMAMLVVVAFGIVFATCAGLYCIGSAADRSSAERSPAPAQPEETDHDHLLRVTKSDSPYAGEQIIKKFLKAPTQAKFSDRELLKQRENYALVRMTVDAPNSFGVMLRQNWCALLFWTQPRGDNFKWNSTAGAWQCSEGFLDEEDLVMREMAIGWPGATDDYEILHPRRKHQRKQAAEP